MTVLKKINSLQPWFRSKTLRFRFGLVVGAGFLLMALLYFYWFGLTHVTTDDAFIEGHVTPISPKVAAHVVKVYVNDNQEVKEGDLLVELDVRDYQARLDMAKAAFQMTDPEAKQARIDAARYKKLVATDEVSKQQYDNAVLRADTAKAKVMLAKSQVEQNELQVSYTKIYAPVSGIITRKAVELGGFVQPGQPLMAIVTPERWVVANFKETQLTHMRPGQKVKIKVDTYPGKDLEGHVDSIQRGTGARFSLLPPENATGNYVKVVQRIPVKIVIDSGQDPKHPLAVGMSVEPEVRVR